MEFFSSLEGFTQFSRFSEPGVYVPLPPDWYVAVSDIQASTEAVQGGQYKEVNSVTTATIAAVLNVLEPIEVPYTFGGDGASFCVPPEKLESVKSALAASRNLAKQQFGLKLRVGVVPMRDIAAHGAAILVGKYQPSAHFKQAVFQGDGLSYAEGLIKDSQPGNPYLLANDVVPRGNFEGFQCRWNEVSSAREEVVTLIVRALEQDPEQNRLAYRHIAERIDEIYGGEVNSHPLNPKNLSLSLSLKKLMVESRIRTAFQKRLESTVYLVRLWFISVFGRFLMASGVSASGVDWGGYKQSLIANSDYRKFDDCLRMVICGQREQRDQLLDFLEDMRRKGKIVYGVHDSPSSILTCIIKDYATEHVHFVDGTGGGYSMAAKMMKNQLTALSR